MKDNKVIDYKYLINEKTSQFMIEIEKRNSRY